MTTIAFDYAVHTCTKRASIQFVREQDDFEVPSYADGDVPLVATYETVVERLDLRAGPRGLVVAMAHRGPLAARRVVNPFADLLVFGSKSPKALGDAVVVSSDREESRQRAQRLAGQSVCIDQVIYRPTAGLVITRTANGHPVVTPIERLRRGRAFDPRNIHDIADGEAPACRGLTLLCPQRATGAWDRPAEIRRHDCEALLRGMHCDLLEVDDRLVRRWSKLLQVMRKEGPTDAVLASCEELLAAFRKSGFGVRAERLLGRAA